MRILDSNVNKRCYIEYIVIDKHRVIQENGLADADGWPMVGLIAHCLWFFGTLTLWPLTLDLGLDVWPWVFSTVDGLSMESFYVCLWLMGNVIMASHHCYQTCFMTNMHAQKHTHTHAVCIFHIFLFLFLYFLLGFLFDFF